MTCCANDIAFIGFKAYYSGAKTLQDRDWIIVEGTIDKEYYPEFQGEGPVIKADSVSQDRPWQRMIWCILITKILRYPQNYMWLDITTQSSYAVCFFIELSLHFIDFSITMGIDYGHTL